MTDIDGLCEGRLLQTGHRYDGIDSFEDVDRVLVLDDSVNSGAAMTETKERLDEEDLPFELEYAAVFISQRGHNFVDYWGEVVTLPRVFEWNLMHHPIVTSSCFDLEGVLCRDPTPEEDDGGADYREYIRTVEPRIIPSERIGWIVTTRAERYRPETEQWLADHDIEYDELVMAGAGDVSGRGDDSAHVAFKADVYSSTDATLFVESDERLAGKLAERAKRPVYCFETNEMVRPGFVAETFTRGSRYIERFATNPAKFVSTAGTYVASQGYNRLSIAAKRYRK